MTLGGLYNIAEQLDVLAEPDIERVETFRTAESGVQRFFDNFLFFLSLIGIFTLLLAGIGIQSALTAFLRERNNTIAVVKTMGATRKFITSHYFAVVAILGLAGTALGLTLGFMLQGVFPILFQSLLPPNVSLIISPRAVTESLLLGIIVVGAFTFMPLYRLEELKPSFIFRKGDCSAKKGNTVLRMQAVGHHPAIFYWVGSVANQRFTGWAIFCGWGFGAGGNFGGVD